MKHESRGHLERLPSGATRATWYGPDGNRERRTFADGDDASLWLAERRIQVKRGVWQPPRPAAPSLGEYAVRWVEERRNRQGRPLKPRTRAEYLATIRGTLAPLLDIDVDTLTAARVRSWYVTLDDRPAQQANAYGLLRSIMATAAADGLIAATPCRIVGGSVKDRATRTVTLTPAEVVDLAAAMPPHLAAAVYTAAWAGLRFGELAELRRGDVAVDGSTVTVAHAVTWTRGKVHVSSPKSAAGLREVAIPPHIAAVLVEHLRVWVDPDPGSLVFTSTRGHRLRPSTLYRAFYAARDAIGRPTLRWHDLRHTGATLAAQAGATLAELMSRIGHSTPGAALRYQHASQERDRLLAARLSELAGEPRLRVVEA